MKILIKFSEHEGRKYKLLEETNIYLKLNDMKIFTSEETTATKERDDYFRQIAQTVC